MIDARVPMVVNLETAIRMYYELIELKTTDIQQLFSCSKSKANQLKDVAKLYQAREGIKTWNASRVNTKAAYIVWGLDIEDLKERWTNLKKLGVK